MAKTTKRKKLSISVLVPCYNEEKSLAASIEATLKQTRPFDEIIFIDDSSTDGTPAILKKYKNRISSHRTPHNTGNKSSAQEFGLTFITGTIVVMTDADTLLDAHFAEEIERSFFDDSSLVALAGRVRSIPHNWLTLCRAFDYAIGQNIHKLAQNYMNYIFVMPGAASAFRVREFRKYITFDHDTLTEDLDFTYKLHRQKLKIGYNPRAISYTQDPADLHGYINQMRRWFAGGWQNLLKHYRLVPQSPIRALELSVLYGEGFVFSILLFVIPLLNLWVGAWMFLGYLGVSFIFAGITAVQERRPMLLIAPLPYMLLIFINAYIYLEQFVIEVVFRRRNLVWFKPDRISIPIQ